MRIPLGLILVLVLGLEAQARQTDPAAVWKALDDGAAEKAASLVGGDPQKLVDLLRKGRTTPAASAGESKEKLKDASGVETDLWLIVPKAYSPGKPAGLIVVLHGLGGTGAQLKELYRGYAEANNFIIAAPSAQKEPAHAPNEDYIPGLSDRYPHWWSYREGTFALSALSMLKKRFAIDENRVILSGYSMGGFGTWNIGLRYADRFSALVPFAGGLSRGEYVARPDERMRKLHLNSFALPIYIVHGDQDNLVPVDFSREAKQRLTKLGHPFEYKEVPRGGHIMNVREGGPIMPDIQKWLKGKARDPHPKAVKHHAIGDYCPQSYWVRILEFKDKAAEVQAAIQGQTIDFTSAGARTVAFYVDETLLDLSKPIVVTSGGRKLFEDTVAPAVDVVLETWRAREDRDLLYRAKVVIEVP